MKIVQLMRIVASDLLPTSILLPPHIVRINTPNIVRMVFVQPTQFHSTSKGGVIELSRQFGIVLSQRVSTSVC